VGLLVLGLAASGLAAASLARPAVDWPLVPGHAVAACGAIVTTVVLIFIDTSCAQAGAYLGLIAAIAILTGGLMLAGGASSERSVASPPEAGQQPPLPGWYPDPRGARLRFWDGAAWSDKTRD
jgi:uncharacterized protein DUF2510